MEITLPKAAMVLVGLVIAGGLGAWGYASSKMEGRLASVRNESRVIGYGRGGRMPTNREVEEQVQLIAVAHQVEAQGVTVQIHTERGLGGIGHLAPQLGESLTGTTRIYEIRGTLTTRELLWSLTEPLEIDLSLRSSVRVRAEGGGGSVRPGTPSTGVSTDVHGGLSPEETGVTYGH
ncbi:MAG: hypothetical protein J0L92_04210 [Deltaproteobacteria bacterium]|nr:hypothetical protein [Deltaproteobacteria bacterium]